MNQPATPYGRDTIDRDTPRCGADKRKRVDLGLDLLARRAMPGAAYSHTEIAAWCGCSAERIRQIERRALRKVRARFKDAREFLEFFNELNSRQPEVPNFAKKI